MPSPECPLKIVRKSASPFFPGAGATLLFMSALGLTSAPAIDPANARDTVAGAARLSGHTDPATVTEVSGATVSPLTSTEQGATSLVESFDWRERAARIRERRDALRDTEFKLQLRTFYLDRNTFDGSESESWAVGGWAGVKTGYFANLLAVGFTGYTSQHLYGDDDKDGALLLKPGQEGYSVLGEAFVDLRINGDIHVSIGRKEFDTPFINRNDSRMTPNTFEAIIVQGRFDLGENGGTIKYGGGYFDGIKERNADTFVPMSVDAGADVDRGVFTGGAMYQKATFSIGAINYYSHDIINIFYAETKYEFTMNEAIKPRVALQFIDQRSTGDDALQGEDFSGYQFGLRGELPWGGALFSAALTHAGGGDALQNPWSGYPGYTSVQVQDFNRDGETAILLRAAYQWNCIEGLSAYGLWVHGTEPNGAGQFPQDEVDLNVQYAPAQGILKGLMLRLRYAIATQDNDAGDDLSDLRMICSYNITW